MDASAPILRFDKVTVLSEHSASPSLADVTFSIGAGELALIGLEPSNMDNPLADVAEGLIAPISGTVECCGQNWATLAPRQIGALRGRIGRLFEGRAWLSNLNVDENIYLAQRYHTDRPYEAIAAEADALARAFGLGGLPSGRPSKVRPLDLRRSACVRAFLGEPTLLILETPALAAAREIFPALLDAVRAARSRGAAVLWTTGEPLLWTDDRIEPTLRCRMEASAMVAGEAIS